MIVWSRCVGLACRECIRMSLRDSVLWQAVIGGLDQMLCSWGSFSIICHRSCTDLEKILPSKEDGWQLGGLLWDLMPWWYHGEGRYGGALEMFWVMTSSGYFLQSRDIARESSSSCSKLSSAIRRLYLRACKKTILSLHLSEWLEWKCRSAAQSVGFL